jgi:hypothetical protein
VAIQFDEIVERYLRPKALTKNLDNSTWNDKTQVWVRTDSSSHDTLAFMQGSLMEEKENGMVQVKLFNGKV